MRLDKYLSESGACTRSEAAKLAKKGGITVNGTAVRSAAIHIDENADTVCLSGQVIKWSRFEYIMLNKPAGLISSTEEGGATVMTLLPPSYSKRGFFPCGRLDRDTLGLLLITNDGQTAHELLSPKKQVMKTYRYGLDLPLDVEGKRALELGADIGGYVTSPAQIAPDGALSGEITISEGKFHQIKRMFAAVGCKVVSLERISFGPLKLDPALGRGEWRYLTEDEISSITKEESV